MKTIKLFTALIFCFSFFTVNAATITLSGYGNLENGQDHDSILVLLERIAPSAYSAQEYTNEDGLFTIEIEKGIYNITYLKTGYRPVFLVDVPLYSDTAFLSVVLKINKTLTFVPTDAATIQGAIDGANTGDTIVVEQGTYKENINFKGKSIILTSRFLFSNDTSDITNTIIDGDYNGHVIEFRSGENQNTQLIGFKIINGKGKNGDYYSVDKSGGGILCYNSSPFLNNLIISNNSTSSNTDNTYGGGIYLYNSNAVLRNLIVKNNHSSGMGGGIAVDEGSNPVIEDCLIESNSTSDGAGILCEHSSNIVLKNLIIKNNHATRSGGGIRFDMCNTILLDNLLVANNTSVYEGGAIIFVGGNIEVKNSSFINNSTVELGAGFCLAGVNKIMISNCIFNNNDGSPDIYNDPQAAPCNDITIKYSDFFNDTPDYFYNVQDRFLGEIITTNENGTPCDAYYNIFVNPSLNQQFSLNNNSPCIDAGANEEVGSENDLAGNQRIFDGNDDSIAVVDMGAYEFGSRFVPIEPNPDPENEYGISGNVYAGWGNLSSGIALLYYNDDKGNSFLPLKYSLVTNGHYEFNSINPGNYIIYVMPDTVYNNDYIPTFYVSELTWEEANVLNVDGKLFDVDIQMLSKENSLRGTGKISGFVTCIDPLELNLTGFEKNVPVILCDEFDNPIDWTLSDMNGFFEFNQVVYSRYKIQIQKPGFYLRPNPLINLTSENNNVDNVMVEIGKEFITISLPDEKITNKEILVYPNPVGQSLNLQMNPGEVNEINIIIYDSYGNTILHIVKPVTPSSLQVVNIPVDILMPGAYFGRVINEKLNAVFRFVKPGIN